MAKKTPQKKTTKKATTSGNGNKKTTSKKKVAAKASTKKKVVKKASTNKSVKPRKASASKATSNKKSVKSTAQKAASKSAVKKGVKKVTSKTTKKVTQKVASQKTSAGTSMKKSASSKTSPNTVVRKKSTPRQNNVSDRIAKLRQQFRHTSSKSSTMELPSKPLSDAQLRKRKSGLSRAELAHFKELLCQKRAELLGDVQSLVKDVKAASESVSYEHMADTGTDNFEQEFNIELMESERAMLQRINDALVRISNKTYGICILTGKPIGKARLEAKPWAKYTISVAREMERLGKY